MRSGLIHDVVEPKSLTYQTAPFRPSYFEILSRETWNVRVLVDHLSRAPGFSIDRVLALWYTPYPWGIYQLDILLGVKSEIRDSYG